VRLTDAEILSEIERIIQYPYRKWRDVPDDPRHRTFHALKIIAARLRAESAEGMTAAIADLGAKIEGMNRSRNDAGEFSETSMRSVALEVRAKWPSILHAFRDHRVIEDSLKAVRGH
jgi:hypothetical protein